MTLSACLQTKKNQEKSWLVICAWGLFLFHGLRDYFITAVYLTPAGNYNSNVNPFLAGLSLASCHLGIMIGQIAIPSLIGKWSLNTQLMGSLLLTGIFALLTNTASVCYWSLIIVRGLQGISQSWIYVITYAVLQERNVEMFATAYSFIFYMPWLGSAVGLAIGCTRQPEVATYIFGALCFLVALGTFLLPIEKPFEMGTKQAWKETVTSTAAICTAAFHAGTALALHTFIMGIPYTLLIIENGSPPMNWALFTIMIVLVTGAFTRLYALLRVWFINSSLLSVLKRRKMLTFGGVIVTSACLCLAGTLGENSIAGLVAPCVVGAAFGGSISISAARMCFHDLAPCFPIPILHIGNIAASFGAALASIMFVGITEKEFDEGNNYNTEAWVIPAIFEVILIGQLIIFLSVDTLPHQFVSLPEKPTELPTISLTMAPSFVTAQSRSIDSKSFKSLRSALTFKTFPSSYATKSHGSFISIRELDTNPSTVWNSESGICHSIVTEDDPELQSIKSDQTYKSVVSELQRLQVQAPMGNLRSDLNRTYEWLSTYHMPVKGNHSQTSNQDEREKAQRNMLLALQW